MGQVLCCCSSSKKNEKELDTVNNKPQRSCLSRFLFCSSEKYLLGRLTGKDYQQDQFDEEFARKLRFKSFSFNDYNEEKTCFLEITPTGGLADLYKSMDFDDQSDYKAKYGERLDTDNSDIDSISSFQSLDEGAIAPLSMDQIRNMKSFIKEEATTGA